MPARAISCARNQRPCAFFSQPRGTRLRHRPASVRLFDQLRRAGLEPRSPAPPVARRPPYASFCARCWAGIATATTSRRSCRCSPRTGPRRPATHIWYLSSRPGATGAGRRAARARPRGNALMSALAPPLQAFFTERLLVSATPARTRSPHTATASGCCSASPTSRPGSRRRELQLEDLDAATITAFLAHLENRARQQCPHPQRAADRDPLVLPLRRAASTPSAPN